MYGTKPTLATSQFYESAGERASNHPEEMAARRRRRRVPQARNTGLPRKA